ncbi:GIY-YIG nuclease family protein [Candidatus Roizmanbacteria bacterium]|nr:GIY-YIG nuclease family protein [Candidatus Roizmanbacteria bacterium]
MNKQWFVYIMTNYRNTVLYTGITNNLKLRILQHKKSINDSFSSRYRLYKLIWFEKFGSPDEAIKIEKKIKVWRREKKINLIKSKNPKFKDLFALR